jgi:hypothetical protein
MDMDALLMDSEGELTARGGGSGASGASPLIAMRAGVNEAGGSAAVPGGGSAAVDVDEGVCALPGGWTASVRASHHAVRASRMATHLASSSPAAAGFLRVLMAPGPAMDTTPESSMLGDRQMHDRTSPKSPASAAGDNTTGSGARDPSPLPSPSGKVNDSSTRLLAIAGSGSSGSPALAPATTGNAGSGASTAAAIAAAGGQISPALLQELGGQQPAPQPGQTTGSRHGSRRNSRRDSQRIASSASTAGQSGSAVSFVAAAAAVTASADSALWRKQLRAHHTSLQAQSGGADAVGGSAPPVVPGAAPGGGNINPFQLNAVAHYLFLAGPTLRPVIVNGGARNAVAGDASRMPPRGPSNAGGATPGVSAPTVGVPPRRSAQVKAAALHTERLAISGSPFAQPLSESTKKAISQRRSSMSTKNK